MSNAEDEIAQLRSEVAALRSAISTAIAMAKVNSELAQALAITNEQPQTLLHVFDALADASDGPMLYSRATDADSQNLEVLREAVRMQLRSLQQKP